MKPRLGVNIDHIATLRQARGEGYPSLVDAAHIVLDAGADQITIHLREDRRHIQDYDVPAIKLVTQKFGVPLNLEMGANDEILEIALESKPEWICLVPEKREELTTEGGLNLLDDNVFKKIRICCTKLKAGIENVKISLFVESSMEILQKAKELPIDAVEIHTGDYARAFNSQDDLDIYLEDFAKAAKYMEENKIGFHAGHGLTDKSVIPLVEQGYFVEYNIGHWIICQSVFKGLDKIVASLKKTLTKGK